MKVILQEDVRSLGNRGEVVDVSRGFARNSLIPGGMAILDTPGNRRKLEDTAEAMGRQDAQDLLAAQEKSGAFEDVSVTISVRVGDQGQLYGSVSASDVLALLEDQGISVDRRMIALDQPIKELGMHTVAIELHREVSVDIKVVVVKEDA